MVRVGCLLFLLTGLILSQPSSNSEIRGLWVVRHNLLSTGRIDSVLRFAAENKFTDLFVQVRGRGDAYYNSHLEPRAERLANDFDPLAYLLKQNQHYHFRIHAWVNVFYIWSDEEKPKSEQHMLNRNPQWLAYPPHLDSLHPDTTLQKRRNAEGWYQSPLQPEVREHFTAVVKDILDQYKLDGIHFDYIRYPGHRFDFNPIARQRFQELYFFDPLEFKKSPEEFIEQYGYTGYEIYFTRWATFLRQELSSFVEKLTGFIHRSYPQITISAAVKADLGYAHWQYFQEWDTWLKNGWLDWAIPMNYTPDDDLFQSRMAKIAQNADSGRILMGISLFNQPVTEVLRKIRHVRRSSCKGFVLFSYDQFQQDYKLRRKYFEEIRHQE